MSVIDVTDALQEWFTERIGAPVDAQSHYADFDELDSFDVMELILFSEKTFAVRFTASDFASADFATLDGLARLIDSKSK